MSAAQQLSRSADVKTRIIEALRNSVRVLQDRATQTDGPLKKCLHYFSRYLLPLRVLLVDHSYLLNPNSTTTSQELYQTYLLHSRTHGDGTVSHRQIRTFFYCKWNPTLFAFMCIMSLPLHNHLVATSWTIFYRCWKRHSCTIWTALILQRFSFYDWRIYWLSKCVELPDHTSTHS